MDLSIAGLICLMIYLVNGGELTFELPDNAHMCFYEELDADVETNLEFQVS